MIRHIRTSDTNVNDHRRRSTSRLPNKARPVFCGAEPSPDDQSRAAAKHVISTAAALKIANPFTAWAAELCPACVERMRAES